MTNLTNSKKRIKPMNAGKIIIYNTVDGKASKEENSISEILKYTTKNKYFILQYLQHRIKIFIKIYKFKAKREGYLK